MSDLLRRPLSLLLALLVPLLCSCLAAPRPMVTGLNDLGSRDVVVVGKVVLSPPLGKGEQTLGGVGAENFRGKFMLFTSGQFKELEHPYKGDAYAGRIEAMVGKTFFTTSDGPFYILEGGLITEFVGAEPSYAHFPAGWKVNIRPGDKAVYIGTIRYHRNEFFNVSKVVVEDDYEEAQGLFAKKFGRGTTLRRALLTPAQ